MASKQLFIPFKGLDNPKTRLSSVLNLEERRALAWSMLHHVLSAARNVFSEDEILVLTRSGNLSLAAPTQIAGRDDADLNAELVRAISRPSTDHLIAIIHADLPNLSIGDLRGLISVVPGELLIAPDRSKLGTNALAFRSDLQFVPSFGEGSYDAHVRAAESLGAKWRSLRRDGLAQDIDTPEHLADISNVFRRANFGSSEANLIA